MKKEKLAGKDNKKGSKKRNVRKQNKTKKKKQKVQMKYGIAMPVNWKIR